MSIKLSADMFSYHKQSF